MNTTPAYGRRLLGLDYRVWLAMLTTCVLSLGLLGYKQIASNAVGKQTCASATIQVEGETAEGAIVCLPNRWIMFQIETDASATVEWNFGDGTPVAKGPIVSHKFTSESDYRIIVIVNKRCEYERKLTVKNPVSLKLPKPEVQIFADSLKVTTGGRINFYCVPNLTGNSYQWKVVETNEVQNDSNATFVFHRPGNYTIQLTVNNDPSTIKTQKIVVTDLPQAAPVPTTNNANPNGVASSNPQTLTPLFNANAPWNKNDQNTVGAKSATDANSTDSSKKASSKPKVTGTDPETFKALLQKVISQNGNVEDLYEYLDLRGETKVHVSGKNDLMDLPMFCRVMQGKKNNTIETLGFSRRKEDNSIQTIEVKIHERKSFFDKIMPFKKK